MTVKMNVKEREDCGRACVCSCQCWFGIWSEAFTLDGKVPLVGSNDGSCACEELGALGAAIISLLWA